MIDDPLIVVAGKLPKTATSGYVGCVMLVITGNDSEGSWFDYRPTFFTAIQRIEWPAGTMHIALAESVATTLFNKGYARPMTPTEALAYNTREEPKP